ncbi:MAG: FixH family protein [Rhodospirillales bacterium]
MKARASSAKQRAPLTGKHVMMMMLGFFGLIIVVNGIFMYFALDSWPGLGAQDAYRKGLAYNETLQAAERQNKLGWRSETAFVARGNNAGRLRVDIRDAQNRAVTGLAVTARLVRPTHEGYDQTVPLKADAQDAYAADVTLPLPGRWRMTIEARKNAHAPYRIERELMVK